MTVLWATAVEEVRDPRVKTHSWGGCLNGTWTYQHRHYLRDKELLKGTLRVHSEDLPELVDSSTRVYHGHVVPSVTTRRITLRVPRRLKLFSNN